jgi:hypothetical protein
MPGVIRSAIAFMLVSPRKTIHQRRRMSNDGPHVLFRVHAAGIREACRTTYNRNVFLLPRSAWGRYGRGEILISGNRSS